jgi:hypothetical protein
VGWYGWTRTMMVRDIGEPGNEGITVVATAEDGTS